MGSYGTEEGRKNEQNTGKKRVSEKKQEGRGRQKERAGRWQWSEREETEATIEERLGSKESQCSTEGQREEK